ncbi:hypothetical protein NF867_09605 [Solitalea sp. MAHUQ-68]|uniref:Uncharacterized protein n=1 Tax=Solitalea agri TaxID=2953739 RepID=A0A9X2F2T1_9SPHI|nr:hypothetical protein [Solitalea agri]MCO4293119.1 hypothetical protein [Solitalea agri]
MEQALVDVYVCSKPLQWFNIHNLNHSKERRNILIVIDSFSGSSDFCKRLSEYDNIWSEILIAESRSDSVKLASKFKIHSLHVDCDYGIVGYKYSLLKPHFFYVIEEGFGPYVDKIAEKSVPFIKMVLFKLLGWGTYLGGAPFTNGIYLYNPAYYINKWNCPKERILNFNYSFFELLRKESLILENVFPIPEYISNVKQGKVLLYLTAYDIKDLAVNYIIDNTDFFDTVIIKLHPHLKEEPVEIKKIREIIGDKLIAFNSNILAELIISNLSDTNELTIINEGSASCLYITDPTIKLIDLKSKYNEEIEMFKVALSNNNH